MSLLLLLMDASETYSNAAKWRFLPEIGKAKQLSEFTQNAKKKHGPEQRFRHLLAEDILETFKDTSLDESSSSTPPAKTKLSVIHYILRLCANVQLQNIDKKVADTEFATLITDYKTLFHIEKIEEDRFIERVDDFIDTTYILLDKTKKNLLDEKEKKIAEMLQQITQLKTEANDSQKRADALQAHFNKLQNTDNSKLHDEYQKAKDTLERKCQILTKEHKEHITKITELEKLNKELLEELNVTTINLTTQKEAFKAQKTLIESLTSQLNTATSKSAAQTVSAYPGPMLFHPYRNNLLPKPGIGISNSNLSSMGLNK